MDTHLPPTITFVDETPALREALRGVRDDVVGVDVERADADRYHRRAALVQVGDADTCVLLDPLALPEPTPLDELLQDRLAVLHAIENDIEPLEALGLRLPHTADTGVAAALLGLPTGLTPLLEEVLGVTLDTDKDRYQRADWEQRPLSRGMVEYAAGDVLHLPALWRELEERLHAADRHDWYVQELAATVELSRQDTRDWTRTKGAGRLDPDQRAVLRAVWEERERICAAEDIAPNRLLHDRTLVDLAADPAHDAGDLVRRNRRPPEPLRPHAPALFEAQERGRQGPPEPHDGTGRFEQAEREAFDRLRRRRSQLASELGVDPGVLCPSRVLRDAVAAAPTDEEGFAAAAGLRPWQREVLLDELWVAYRGAIETTAP